MGEWDDERVIDYGKLEREEAVGALPAPMRPVAERRVESPAVRSEKNPIMAEMGKSGGRARAVSLTPERRREIARLGGLARAAGKKEEG